VQRSIIKIFLASPGDLIDERKAAKRIVDEENINHAIPQGVQFELVGWEDTVAQHGRAQAVINRDLDQCNYFVGLLWKRWGTPPGPNDGPYSSGFEEEYERSETRYNKTGKPHISLLFKAVSNAEISDAGPQLTKVLKFKKRFTDDHRGIYQTFEDFQEFEKRFRSVLAMFLRKEMEEDSKNVAEERSRTLDTGNEPEKLNADHPGTLFGEEVKEFVSDLLSRPIDPKDYEFSAFEAARLRLLGTTLKRSENDDIVIGVHDANILYKEFKGSEISKREIRGLLKAGLHYFNTQNAPIWRWLTKLDSTMLHEATLRSLVGSDIQRKSAFRILSFLTDADLDLGDSFNRLNILEWWLNADESELIVAALSYLGHRGIREDLEKIDLLLDVSEVEVSKAAVSAKIGILEREGAEYALEFISTREDADVSEHYTNLILNMPGSIKTELLHSCISNRSTEFRRRVAQELLSRNELSIDDANILIQSPDAQTRLLGAYAVQAVSPNYSLSDAREHIVKPKNKYSNSLLSIGDRDYEGEVAFKKFMHTALCNHKLSELERLINTESLYEYDVIFALYDKFFSKYRTNLIQNLGDGFSSFLREKIDQTDIANRPDEKLADFICQKMIQKAVELLAEKNSQQDIQPIREAIDQTEIKYADNIVRFFELKGSWEDVHRVIHLSENFQFLGMSLLTNSNNQEKYRAAAKAILKLGGNRIADLLSIPMPSQLWNEVIIAMSKSSFVSFSNDRISEWLSQEIDSKRKVVALKSVICLPKSRIEKLLGSYTTDRENYYYNVVSWLDLGVSMKRNEAVKIAKQELAEV
jgi:hypothetical protein